VHSRLMDDWTGLEESTSPNADTVREVQRLLTELGYQPGPIDGTYGPMTASAIREFQRDNRMQVDGRIDDGLVPRLRLEILRKGSR
jgi:peptidoglycan hydrolase-like protein with peptidoglycan-binding domain